MMVVDSMDPWGYQPCGMYSAGYGILDICGYELCAVNQWNRPEKHGPQLSHEYTAIALNIFFRKKSSH